MLKAFLRHQQLMIRAIQPHMLVKPVNQIEAVLGEEPFACLQDVPGGIDIVDIFRRSEFVPEVVDQAIQLRVPAIWMQEGVIHETAAAKARQAGLLVIMDRCILKEHRARFR